MNGTANANSTLSLLAIRTGRSANVISSLGFLIFRFPINYDVPEGYCVPAIRGPYMALIPGDYSETSIPLMDHLHGWCIFCIQPRRGIIRGVCRF